MTPRTLVPFFGENNVTTFINNTFDHTKPVGMIIYVALIIAFTYFYAFVQVNPENVADNLKSKVLIFQVFVLVKTLKRI